VIVSNLKGFAILASQNQEMAFLDCRILNQVPQIPSALTPGGNYWVSNNVGRNCMYHPSLIVHPSDVH